MALGCRRLTQRAWPLSGSTPPAAPGGGRAILCGHGSQHGLLGPISPARCCRRAIPSAGRQLFSCCSCCSAGKTQAARPGGVHYSPPPAVCCRAPVLRGSEQRGSTPAPTADPTLLVSVPSEISARGGGSWGGASYCACIPHSYYPTVRI